LLFGYRYQINTAKGILDTILSVQPKEGGSQGGETRESIVYKLADDMLEKIPQLYNNFEASFLRGKIQCVLILVQVKEALNRMGALLPMNIFLRQEIDRIQRVINEVQTTLVDLKLAIDGTIIMSSALKESLDAMYDARIPASWQKVGLNICLICFIKLPVSLFDRYPGSLQLSASGSPSCWREISSLESGLRTEDRTFSG